MIFSRSLLPLGCGLLLAASHALAQQIPPPPSFTPPPPPTGTPPTLPPNLPGVPSNPNASAGDDSVRLTFSNSPVGDVLYFYGQITGKRVLTDNTVNATSLLTFEIAKSVPRTEAVRIIETVLNLNGYSIAPGENNIVKVLGPGKNPRSVGIPIYSDPAELPRGEQVVSFLLRLRYLDPTETAGVLLQYVPPGNSVNFTALEKAGAIIVTDDATTVRRLVELVASLDQPFAPVTEKWIRLERADATKAIEFLNSVFDSKSSAASNSASGQPGGATTTSVPNGRRPIRRTDDPNPPADLAAVQVSNNGSGPITLSGDSIIQGRITLTADVRTNRVHVVTSAANMVIVEHLLEEYDADTPFAEPVPRPLKFVNASDMLSILVQALSEPGAEATGSTSSSTGTSSTGTSGNRGTTGSSSNSLNNIGSTGSSSGSSSSGGGGSDIGSGELNTQAVDTKPTIAIVGSTKIIADPRVNSILVLGSGEARDKVFAILDRLDVRPKQVIIRTVIGELSLGKNSELGFNYLLRTNRSSLLSNFNSGQLPGVTTTSDTSGLAGTGSTSSTTTASALNTFSTLATGLGSSFSGVGGIIAIGKSFDVILSALEGTSRFKTISRPMIFTSNNKEAIIASGQQIAVPTETVSSLTTSANSTGLTSNVEYKDVVLELEVVPLINSENEVTLDIVQRIDNVVTTASPTIVAGNSLPTIATRKLKSTVSAPNNSTIVLGGLITQDSSVTDSNIPYLSRIPVVGALFRSRTRAGDRSELIILMHPEVVNTADLLAKVQENEAHRTYLGNGVEDQLLPAEVRKATAVTTTTTTTVPVSALPPTAKEVVTRRKHVAPDTTKKTVRQTTTTVKVKKEPDLDHF